MSQPKWDPVPKEYIPSTLRETNPGTGWIGPVIITVGMIAGGFITFLGGFMVGRGM